MDRLKNAQVSQFVFTNTLPAPGGSGLGGGTVLPVTPLPARARRGIFENGPVTGLPEKLQALPRRAVPRLPDIPFRKIFRNGRPLLPRTMQ